MQGSAVTARVSVPAARGRSGVVQVFANKKVKKMTQVVLVKGDENLGKAGEMVEVTMGYFRNYLEPSGLAKKATADILKEFEEKQAAEVAAKQEVMAGANALKTALATIGKFVVKKTVGEDGKIFGSVTAQVSGFLHPTRVVLVPHLLPVVGREDVFILIHASAPPLS